MAAMTSCENTQYIMYLSKISLFFLLCKLGHFLKKRNFVGCHARFPPMVEKSNLKRPRCLYYLYDGGNACVICSYEVVMDASHLLHFDSCVCCQQAKRLKKRQ